MHFELYQLSDEERAENERLGEQMRAADEEARCKCDKREPDEYELSIDCGGIEIYHVPCGKQPWFMFDDWNEVIRMSPQKIVVKELGVNGCSCYEACECGPEIYLKTPEGKW